MAKGQKRTNREVRKPKKKKEATSSAPPVLVAKGATVSIGAQKKKS